MFITQRIFNGNGAKFTPGWITSKTGDGGTDFVGRIDFGSDFSVLRIIVLGQAKCEKMDTPTNGRDIARTVARLKRGWVGAYVKPHIFQNPCK